MQNAAVASVGLLLLLFPRGTAAQQKTQLPARDRMLPETPELLYTVGAEGGEHWEVLSGVRAVAFDARDRLYVLDANNFRVLVFDTTGKFVRSLGRHGGGPGEFSGPTGMTVTADGTIVVSDGRKRSYSLFASDGSFIKNVSYVEGEGVGGRMEGLHSHPRRGIVVPVFPMQPREQRAAGVPSGERRAQVKWLDVTGAAGAGTSLFAFTMPSIKPKVERGPGRGVSITSVPANWTPALTLGVLPNGAIVVADEAEYRVKVVSPDGNVDRIMERGIAPRKGTQKDRELFIKREAESLIQNLGQSSRSAPGNAPATSSPPPVSRIEEMLRNAEWHELIPVLRRVTADPQGRIWVARTPEDFGLLGPVDLLRADGAYIGTIPNTVVPGAVSRTGRAAFIERDELGVERVSVKRLPATWR